MHDAKQALYKHLELVIAEPSFVINYKVNILPVTVKMMVIWYSVVRANSSSPDL